MTEQSDEYAVPQPCLTRRDGEVCHGTLIPISEREWHCTEGHTMWGTARALRSEPWPADRMPNYDRPPWDRPLPEGGPNRWIYPRWSWSNRYIPQLGTYGAVATLVVLAVLYLWWLL